MDITEGLKALGQIPGLTADLLRYAILARQYPGLEQIPTEKLKEFAEPLSTLLLGWQRAINGYHTLNIFLTHYLKLPELTMTRYAITDWMKYTDRDSVMHRRVQAAVDSNTTVLGFLDIAVELDRVDRTQIDRIIEKSGPVMVLAWRHITASNEHLTAKEGELGS